jgi:hypothetical protein
MRRFWKWGVLLGLGIAGFRIGHYMIARWKETKGVPWTSLEYRRAIDAGLSGRFPIVHLFAGAISPVVEKGPMVEEAAAFARGDFLTDGGPSPFQSAVPWET